MYAKEAVDALWKARGYHKMKLKMKPKHREEKLGYQLDREEALGYLVTSGPAHCTCRCSCPRKPA